MPKRVTASEIPDPPKELAAHDAAESVIVASKKRRGRPPKIQSAVVQHEEDGMDEVNS